HRLRADRPEAQAPGHDAPARAACRGSEDRGRARHVHERGDARPDERARGAHTSEATLALFGECARPYIQNTLDKDPSTREEEALVEVFKKQRPGEPPTLANARNHA